MKLGDKIEVKRVYSGFDEKLNPVEVVEWDAVGKGKCIIMPNTSARATKTNDGKEYIYSYEIIMRKPKSVSDIPTDNDVIRLTKEDGSISDKECRVVGYVTMKTWLKLWV